MDIANNRSGSLKVFPVTLLITVLTIIVIRKHWGKGTPKVEEIPKPKSLTFRVDDIPKNHSDELCYNLRSLLEKNRGLGDANSILLHSLVQQGKDSLCATISITTLLPGPDLSQKLHIISKGKSLKYRYSSDFNGITPLYAAPDAQVDIIAVHGLGANPLGSWKSSSSDEVWLRDLLPKDLPNIRVLLYGYDTTLPGSRSKQSFNDLGRSLLEQLIAFRQQDSSVRRPIILLGHSLGGVVIKEALLLSNKKKNDDAYTEFSCACYGLLFFGVPNLGLRNPKLLELVKGQPNEALVRDILLDQDGEPSNLMRGLEERFSDTCRGQYRVVSFYERLLSPTIECDAAGKWTRTGPPSLMVTQESATHTGLVPISEEDIFPLNTDHSQLVKYNSRNQESYTVVRGKLGRLIEEAKTVVANRFSQRGLQACKSKSKSACLRALAFGDMESRVNQIHSNTSGTFKWFLKHNSLTRWMEKSRGLLWIKGKPGSGKSTLMKYALDTVPAEYGAETVSISFFFHGRGEEMQKSPLGLFQSLIHQLLWKFPGALPDLIDFFEEQQDKYGPYGDKWKWELQPLQGFLRSSLLKVLERFPVIIFIDALDECGEEQATELVEFLNDLRLNIPDTTSSLGILFSCREYPVLENTGEPTIHLDAINHPDIAIYIKNRLGDSATNSLVRDTIAARAKGIFLWAALVINRVLVLERRGESESKIKAAIDQTPKDLNNLYDKLIQEIKEDHLDTLKLVRWICFSRTPLSATELQWAMAIDPVSTQSLEECEQSDNFIVVEKIANRVKYLSCGLAELVYTNSGRVQFIHQSVKDYFLHGGLLTLLPPQAVPPSLESVAPAAHCILARCCIQYLGMIERPFKRGEGEPPFLFYALTSWITHTKLGEPAEDSPNKVLDLLEGGAFSAWLEAYPRFRRFLRPDPKSEIIHIVAEHGLTKYLSCLLLERGAQIDAKASRGETPLVFALQNRHEASVKLLRDCGAQEQKGRLPGKRRFR